MRGVFEPAIVEINGKQYDVKAEVSYDVANPKILNRRKIVIPNDDSVHPELSNLELYSVHIVTEMNFPFTLSGEYRYMGNNVNQHIFED
jgi:hypothetical protein